MIVQEMTEGTLMKIHVNRIPAEGLREHATYDPAALDMERDDVRLLRPFEVDAFMTKTAKELVVAVDIRCPLHLVCARCLEGFDSTVATRSLFNYTVQPADVVDITDDVRQEIILAYPMIPVCRSDCRGLCSACGQNLNIGSCGHHAAGGRSSEDWLRGGSIAV